MLGYKVIYDYADLPDPAAPYLPVLMRQADCSLTRVILDTNNHVQEIDASYQDALHNALQIPTTADKFPNGCKDATTGISSQAGAVVGTYANGQYVAALSVDGFAVFQVPSTVFQSPSLGAITRVADYPFGNGVFGFAAADLNGDGTPDIVVASEANATMGTLTILLGKGNGTYATGQVLSVVLPSQGAPVGVTIDDLNGDGKLDLIAVTAGTPAASGITVFLGNGDGTFQASGINGPGGTGGIVAVTADFNGDGKKDIATSFGQILLGNGDGTFQAGPAMSQEGQQTGIAAADFNQDGKTDLAFANGPAATVDVYFGNGDGTFSYSASYPVIYAGGTVGASDLDGDGHSDLFIGTAVGGLYGPSKFSGGFFQPLLNYGNGIFGPSQAYFPNQPSQHFDLNPSDAYLQYATGNFTSSGKPDLLMVANGTSGAAFSVLQGNGDGSFKQTPIQTQLNNPSAPQFIVAIASGDVNGDRKPDVVFAWSTDTFGTSPTLSLALGNGDGTFQPQHDYPLPAAVLDSKMGNSEGLVLADLRGTGKLDVVFTTGSACTSC